MASLVRMSSSVSTLGSRQSATRIFQELEYSGLIIRKKQGLGKPALITLNYPADAKLIAKEGEDAQA